jgi:glutamyl-tRNA synthetase
MSFADTASNIVTRFAPSPTGYLHVGGARTALYNWLLARHAGGKYLLRIEDTDLARSTQEAVETLLEDLAWLGLDHDNAELVFQSKRKPVYDRIIDQLLADGRAYEAYETDAELAALREQAAARKQSFVYRRPTYSPEQVARFKAENRTPVVRFAMPMREYRFTDQVLGEIVLPPAEVQDFVIRKSDGMPTYHFAVVVDDAEMGVTHVLRGQEHLKNTFLHIALQNALGYPRPVYAHLSTILNPESGQKLSKRDRDRRIRQRASELLRSKKLTAADLVARSGLPAPRIEEWLANDKSQLDLSEQPKVMAVVGLRESDLPEIMVHDFRKNGYLPEVLNNFIALCGWSPGGDRERMSMDEMVRLFRLEDVGKSNAKFNREKLLAFNTEACAAASDERLLAALKDYLSLNADSPLRDASPDQLLKLLHMKKGFRTLRDVDEPCRFFFVPDDQIAYDPQAVEKVLRKSNGEGLIVLRDVRQIFATINDWRHEPLEMAIKQYCEHKGLGLGKVAQPIRVAISGTTVSPPIFESIEFLGKERTLARIDRSLNL